MRFCHLVASVPLCSAWTVQCSQEQQGNLIIFVPRDKLAVLAAMEVFFSESLCSRNQAGKGFGVLSVLF